MVFNSQEKLQEGLDACVRRALQETGSPLVFAHACWGDLAESSALRMTRIDTATNQELPLVKFVAGNGIDHKEAFRRHILRFGRSGTLLDWITRWMYRKCGSPPLYERTIAQEVRFLVTRKKNAPPLTEDDGSIVVSDRFFRALDDSNVVMQYLAELYSRDMPPHTPDSVADSLSYVAQQLVSLRYDARRMLATAPGGLARLKPLTAVYSETDPVSEQESAEFQWMFLGALQTGFMYVQSSHAPDDVAGGFVSVGACYVSENNEPRRCPLGVISAVLPKGMDGNNVSRLSGAITTVLNEVLLRTVGDIDACRDRPVRHHLLLVTKTGELDRNRLTELATALAPIPPEGILGERAFPEWQPALLLWLTLVTEGLRGNVHEGKPLSFYFIMADRSQVLDSGLFETIEFALNSPEALVPWEANGKPLSGEQTEKLLNRVRRQVGKKNYAWFLDGKFALLWDATFPSWFPRGLIRLKESSWEVFLNHVHMRKPCRASEIISAMVYVSQSGAGGIILKGRQIASFRKGQPWLIGIGEREKRLRACLNRHLGQWERGANNVLDETLKSVQNALLAVSDDPHMGCMLAIFGGAHDRDAVERVFGEMGEPWKTQHKDDLLEKSLDELTALMMMDGTTCLYLARDDMRPKVVFRRLVKVPDTPSININKNDREALDGEGSRKWSAAHAATRPEVSAVISVSQDGPIHVYELNETPKKEVRIWELEEYPLR